MPTVSDELEYQIPEVCPSVVIYTLHLNNTIIRRF
jgi:hypothetical protein